MEGIFISLMWCCAFIWSIWFYTTKNVVTENKRKIVLDKFPEIMALVDTIKPLAIEKIWRDELVVHITSEYSLEKKDVIGPIKNYVKLLMSMIGPAIKEDLITIFGDESSLYSYLSSEFIFIVNEKELEIRNKYAAQSTSSLNNEQPLNYKDLIKFK